jgi:hypothetical protein
MRLVDAILLIAILVSGIFGYAGLFTSWGEQHFKEMDGLIPFFSLVLSGGLLLLFLLVRVMRFYKKEKR